MEPMHQKGACASLMAALVGAILAQGCELLTQIDRPPVDADGKGGAGGGGEGPGKVTCLDPSASASLFTIADPSFCAVAIYEADMSDGVGTPSWGAHGGPLTVSQAKDGSVDLVRWKLPAGATGKLSAAPTRIDAVAPADAFPGDHALDLPFFGWTALSWTGAFPKTQGEIVLLKGASVDKRYAISGAFAMASVASGVNQGRLLVSALSAIGDATSSKNALYAADSCGTAEQPALLPDKDPSCKPPLAIASFGEASGPVAADRDGDVFALMTAFSGDQEARGFAASAIARGQGATDGTKLFTLPGFGSSLAAIAPHDGKNGVVIFQPVQLVDAMNQSYEAQDMMAQGYSVSGGSVKAEGVLVPFLKLTKANTSLSLMRDDQDRLWVRVPGASGSTFVVIARSP